MSLRIMLGDYGTGKTTMAKYLAKKAGGIYLDIDEVTNLNELAGVVNNGKCYFMDGWPRHYSYKVLNEMLGTDIKLAVCMAEPAHVLRRQKAKSIWVDVSLPKTIPEIINVTHEAANIALTYDNDPLFIETTFSPPRFWDKTSWLNRWIEMCLYSQFKDKYEYQDIEFSDRTLTGLSQSYKTWQRLSRIIDFKDKTVCDLGCNYGYFSFKAEEAGAKQVIGVDISPSVINIASNLAMSRNSRVEFVTMALGDYCPPRSDIILALNVLHHVNNDPDIIGNLFKSAIIAVAEIPEDDIGIVNEAGEDNDYHLRLLASSHREGRCIAIYSKQDGITIPAKYEYKHKTMASKKLLHFIARLAHILTFGHVGLLRKIYLRRFR